MKGRASAVFTGLFVVGVLTLNAGGAPPPPPAPSVETLLATQRTVLDQEIVYPSGAGKVTSEVVTLPRGASTIWHTHPVPMFAQILEGELAVDYESVGERRYRKGDTFVEAIDWPHRGRNVGKKPVKILVLYSGAEGTPNSVPVEED